MKKQKVEDIYAQTMRQLRFGFKGSNIYLKKKEYWKKLSEDEAVLEICGLFDSQTIGELRDSNVREALKRLRNNPDLQIEFTEAEKENFINLQNGVFDVEQGKLLERTEDFQFSYVLKFQCVTEPKLYRAPNFEQFLKTTFPDAYEEKSRLLLEVFGYCLSDYLSAKTAFFLIGESNSGKSTVLELLEKIFPEETVTAIPLHRLSNRFNVARLENKKLNICTELAENSLAALDIFKQLTANEVVTAEHKGKPPFEFRIRCKSINAGNMLPKVDALEGMEAVINRMTILLFRESIPKEKQDKGLLGKLWEERDAIFSLALEALVDLRKKNFSFLEPQDTQRIKKQMFGQGRAFEEFLEDCCVYEEEGRIHIATLFEAFERYCEQNLLDVKFSKMQFAQRIYNMKGIQKKKMRIAGSPPLHGIKGLRLKGRWEYNGQDSEE